MKFENPYKKWVEGMKKADRIRRANEVAARIQVREFSGDLFLSYNDIPLVNVSDLKSEPCEQVSRSRKTVALFLEKHDINN